MDKRIPHGTTTGYGPRYRCRCDDCRRAVREYMRAYYAKRRAEGRPLKGGKRHKRDLVCEHCGAAFRAESSRQRFCSQRCNSRHRYGWSTCTDLVHVGPVPEPVAPPTPVTVVELPKWWSVITNGPCAWCGETFTATSGSAKYCSRRCTRSVAEFRRGERFVVEPRFRYAIYQRDGWTCQLCFEAVDRDAGPLSDWYPSLDHIVPQSRGGSDEWENLRLVHRWCNAVRGDGRWHSDFFKVVTEGVPS